MSTPGVADTSSALQFGPAQQIAVDPWMPCLMYRATSAQDLDRSADGGQTWTRVFHDASAAPAAGGVNGQPFSMRNITIPAPGMVVLAENGNGDAAVISRDSGGSWQLADGGVAGQPISSITFAPGSSRVAYATVDTDRAIRVGGSPADLDSAAGVGLYVTRDGGASWSAADLPALPIVHDSAVNCAPCPAYPQIQIDPANPGRIWVLVSLNSKGQQYAQTQAVLESADYGATWSPPIALPSAASQLLVTRAGGVLRLFVADYVDPSSSKTPVIPSVSTDDGASWTPLPVQGMPGGVLIADPADPDHMGYFGMTTYGAPQTSTVTGTVTASQVVGYISSNAFDAAESVPPLTGFDTPAEPETVLRGGTVSAEPTFLAQADNDGSFYLAVHDRCTLGSGPNFQVRSCFGGPPPSDTNTHTWERQAYWRFTPPGGAGPAASGGPNGSGGASGGGGSGAPTQYPQLVTRNTCAVPQSAGNPRGVANNGSLTFDGRYLLYTQYLEATGPTEGVIHRMDPATCADRGVISVSFAPSDMAAVRQRIGPGAQYPRPYIDTLTYDPNHDAIWFSLQPAPRAFELDSGLAGAQNPSPADIVPMFRANLADATAPSARATATLVMFAPHLSNQGQGADLLAYDYSDDTLWTATWPSGLAHDGLTAGMPAHVHAEPPDGHSLGGCVNTAWGSSPDRRPSPAASVVASWTVTSPADIFIQLEDDITVIDVDKQTCAVTRAFQHRDFNEPANEDEQLVCDSLTFDDASVLWLRDASTASLVAYRLPAGTCPFPTTTTYLGAFQAASGSTAQMCASLVQRGAATPLGGQPLEFLLNGVTAGAAVTDSRGIACVHRPVTLSGGVYPVVARFAGTERYLASFDIASLAVPAAPPAISLGAQPFVPAPADGGGGGAPPEPLQQQAPGAEAGTVQQAQAQAQTEAQSQAQTQATAQLQPAMSVQRRRQAQTAAQTVATPSVQGQSLLAARQPPPLISAWELASGALLVGLMLLRRPQLTRRTSAATGGPRLRSTARRRDQER